MNKIDKFLDARIKAFALTSPQTFWPANGAQLYSYFSDEEAWDLFQKIKKIRKEKISLKEIAKLFYAPTTIRYYIGSNSIRGLKVRKKYVGDITQQDISDFMDFFFELLENMQSGDIFCSEDKNEILNKKELSDLIKEYKWNIADDETQRAVARLIIFSSTMVWTLYYDCMAGNGLENHGPYDVSEYFGKNSILIIREFFNLKPVELWGHCKDFKYDNIKIYTIYKNLENIGINYFSHIVSKSAFRDKLTHFYILVDGKEINNLDEINKVVEEIVSQINKQKELVNSLSVEDKIKKGAESSYYSFKKFREFFGENWKPKIVVEKALDEFGLEFWNKFKEAKRFTDKESLEFLRKLLDPREDFLG